MITTVYKVDYLNCDGDWMTFPENYNEAMARSKAQEIVRSGYKAMVRKEFVFKRG